MKSESDRENQATPDDKEDSRKLEQEEQKINIKNYRVRIDYEESSAFKEIVFRILDQQNSEHSKFLVSKGLEDICEHDLDDERNIHPLDTDHRPIITEN